MSPSAAAAPAPVVSPDAVIRRRAYVTFATITVLVVLADLVTKWLAITLWGTDATPILGGAMAIAVVRNPLAAFSTSLGTFTWEINVITTTAAVVLGIAVCGRLARIAPVAPAALGMVVGAALGNLTSLAGSPGGVPDFLAIPHGHGDLFVLNTADVAAYLGIIGCGQIVWALVTAVRRTRGQGAPAAAAGSTPESVG